MEIRIGIPFATNVSCPHGFFCEMFLSVIFLSVDFR
jgi:hypothetical protein